MQKASEKMKEILILGSTGSIGSYAIEIVNEFPELYRVKTLVAQKNVHKLAEQAKKIQPDNVVIEDENLYAILLELLKDRPGIKISAGRNEVLRLSREKYDLALVAITGIAALQPLMCAVENSKVIALANKESIICGGDFVLQHAANHGTKIVPVDSEHSAIFQIFETQNKDKISKIILTASGGPFWHCKTEEIQDVTPEMAVKHPNWNMGAKISVDSATMMNKGLEVIEAMRLFNIELNRIEVLVHPQSLVHGLVEYKDGTTLMHMSDHSMKIPISYAFSYPERQNLLNLIKPVDLIQISELKFYPPDYARFPMLRLALDAAKAGNAAIVALNVSNEIAVEQFLKGVLKFQAMYNFVDDAISNFVHYKIQNLEDVYALDSEIRHQGKFLYN